MDTGRVELHNAWSSDEDPVKFITSIGGVRVVIAKESGVSEFQPPLKTTDLTAIDVSGCLNVQTTNLWVSTQRNKGEKG